MNATRPETLLEQAAWVRRLARGLVADVHGAADLEQETWLAALTHTPDAGAEAGWGRGWLARVAANLAHRSRRARARAAEREELAARCEAQPSAAELVERAELTRVLVAHVVSLEEPYRSTLLLRYFEELSPSAIARREGIPLRTVKTRLARGLAQLRERLDRSSDRESWFPALLASCSPPRVPLPLVPTLILMKTSTKVLCAALLLFLLGGGVWLAQHGEEPSDVRAAAQPVVEPPPAPAVTTSAPSAPAPGPERATAPTPEPSSATAPAPLASALRGRVIDRSGQPIAGARVELSTVAGAVFNWSASSVPEVFTHTQSGADGKFSIELAPSRVGELSAAAKGFGKAHAGRRRSGDFVEIVLEPAGTIEGHVTRGPERAPVEGARIVVRGTDNAVYNPALAEAITDADGLYRVEDLAARDYWIWLASPRAASPLIETVSVASAATVVHDFETSAVRAFVVRGQVTDASSSAAIGDALVSVEADTAHTDATGAFELRSVVAEKASKVTIKVGARGFLEQRVEVASEGAMNVEIALTRGQSVSGKVVGPDGEPIEGAQIALFDDAKGQSPSGGIRARSESGGSFEVDGLKAGARCGLVVVAEGFAAAAFELPAIESAQKDLGEIELASASALVATIVDDAGKPWTDCDVWLYGGDAGRARFTDAKVEAFDQRFGLRMNKTRTDGRAVFGELAAGEYILKTRVAGRSAWVETSLTLDEGEVRDDFDVVIPRGLALRGRTLDPEGRPVAGVFVLVQRQGSDDVAGSANVGSDGVFEIAGLESGEHVLRTTMGVVSSPEARKRFASGKWTVTAGGEPLELVMPLVSSIAGRVIDADGKPITGASVSAWDAGAGMADASGRTGANGEFKLSVRAGATFELRANMKVGDAVVRGSLAVVAAGAEEVELRLAAQ
ncbi:MAG: sigma-70 family RNA polymerase sigma factor [Planctomycetota bacterium]